MKKLRYLLVPVLVFLIIGGFSLSIFITPDKDISVWERRKLQQFPEISLSGITSGSFMRDFEAYLSDQFPLRNSLRSLKASFHFNVLKQKDNNDIYVIDSNAGKLDRKISQASVSNFAKKINALKSTFLDGTDCKAYFSFVPDKNFFLTQGTLYPSYSFEQIVTLTEKELYDFEKIDIYPLLNASSYYTTDSHWKQEEIVPVANRIREVLGVSPITDLSKNDAGEFYGVYYGQSALALKADRLCYLTNAEIESSTVESIEKEGITKVYDTEKLDSFDKYNFFLSGPVSILEINNPAGEKGKELIIFRDSYASSLAPLLIPEYSKVTLIDTRYIAPELIGNYVEFDNQDVLFIYSTSIINNSMTLK